MKIAPVAEVKAKFSAYLKASVEGPVVVTRYGKPVAVLLSVEDEEELERLILAYTPRFRAILDAARRDAMLKAIVSIVIDVESIEAQKNLIQHKGETEHRGAIAGLRSRDHGPSHTIAAMIEQTATQKFG